MLNIIDCLKDSFVDISTLIRYSNSIKLSTTLDINNISGDLVKHLDIETNTIIKNKLLECNNIRAIGSEEEDTLHYTKNVDGDYLVCYDPLDGPVVNINFRFVFAGYQTFKIYFIYFRCCVQEAYFAFLLEIGCTSKMCHLLLRLHHKRTL